MFNRRFHLKTLVAAAAVAVKIILDVFGICVCLFPSVQFPAHTIVPVPRVS